MSSNLNTRDGLALNRPFATSTEHRKGIKDGAVANEIEHRVNLLALRDVGPEVATFDFHAFGTEVPEHREPVLVSGRGDDMGAGIDRHIERGLSKRGGGAANDYRLSRLEFEVSEQARPGGGIRFGYRREVRPGQVRFNQRDIAHRRSRIFGIAAIDRPSEAAHQGRHLRAN